MSSSAASVKQYKHRAHKTGPVRVCLTATERGRILSKIGKGVSWSDQIKESIARARTKLRSNRTIQEAHAAGYDFGLDSEDMQRLIESAE